MPQRRVPGRVSPLIKEAKDKAKDYLPDWLVDMVVSEEIEPSDFMGPMGTAAKGGMKIGSKLKKLFRVEDKVIDPQAADWILPHLNPTDQATYKATKGRYFTDNIDDSERFGIGEPDKQLYETELPGWVASAAKRKNIGYDEYIVPPKYADGKKPVDPPKRSGDAMLRSHELAEEAGKVKPVKRKEPK